jgi:trans-aconitate 2-methyltransferase
LKRIAFPFGEVSSGYGTIGARAASAPDIHPKPNQPTSRFPLKQLQRPPRRADRRVTDAMTEWSGEEYASISDLQRSMAEEAAASLDFAGDETVLDIGCGDGHVTRALSGHVPEGFVVGVDPSQGMLTEAARHHQDGSSAPAFVRADVRRLPFAERFDVAVSFNALHWVPQQLQALTEISSVVRRGARLLIQMVCASERPSVEAVAMTVCERPRWAPRFSAFAAPFVHVDPATYGDLAAEAGFT